MPISLLKVPDIVARTKRSRAKIYEEIKEGRFPLPIKIGRGAYWRDDEVEKIVMAYSASASSASLKTLCADIYACRVAP